MIEGLSNPNIKTERLNHKSFGFWFALIVALICLTQIIRLMVMQLEWPNFLNQNFAFSLNIPIVWMYKIYVVVMFSVIYFLKVNWQKINFKMRLGFVLIICGGLSNIFERLLFGYVVDYFFILDGVLNLADFYIIFGALLVVIEQGISPKQVD